MTALAGKTAIVTGGSRGIGGAITRRLTREGAKVAFTYLDRKADADTLSAEIVGSGGEPIAIQADSADPAAVTGAIETAAAKFGGLDILVNNAGVTVLGQLEQLSA